MMLFTLVWLDFSCFVMCFAFVDVTECVFFLCFIFLLVIFLLFLQSQWLVWSVFWVQTNIGGFCIHPEHWLHFLQKCNIVIKQYSQTCFLMLILSFENWCYLVTTSTVWVWIWLLNVSVESRNNKKDVTWWIGI